MSTTAPVTPSPSAAVIPDKYTLHDGLQTTQVTYYPMAPGPIISGKTEPGPEIQYTGEEGNFTFSNSQITSVNSPLGSVMSVTLRPNTDSGALIFTLVLPNVTVSADSKTQAFRTIAVKTHTRGLVVAPGADRTYDAVHLHGTAEVVALPV